MWLRILQIRPSSIKTITRSSAASTAVLFHSIRRLLPIYRYLPRSVGQIAVAGRTDGDGWNSISMYIPQSQKRVSLKQRGISSRIHNYTRGSPVQLAREIRSGSNGWMDGELETYGVVWPFRWWNRRALQQQIYLYVNVCKLISRKS